MKRLLFALLSLGVIAVVSAQVTPSTALSVDLTTRNLKVTSGDALGYNIPAWPILAKSGSVLEFAAGSTLKVDVGATVTGITSSPGGTTGQLQYNNAGSMGGTGVTWNGSNLTGLGNPSNSTDAANKGYVDSASAGLTVRTPVNVATTANITLSGEQTIDGIATSASRVLVKNQTSTQNNGIYTSASGAWSRASDSNTAGTLAKGYYYFVSSGTTQGASSWTITTAPTVLGTDPVVFSQFSASQVYSAGTGLTLAGSTFSVNAAQPGVTSLGTLSSLTVSGVENVSGQASAKNYTATGAISSLTASSAFMDVATGTTPRIGSVGANAVTYGSLKLTLLSSNASLLTDVATFTSAGQSINGTLSASGNITGSATVAGPEFKAGYGLATGPIAAYDSTTGGIYYGFGSGLGIIRSVADNSGAYAPLSFQVGNGTQILNLTSTGATLNGVLALDSNSHVVTTKNNLHVILNVKDYGALGDGTTNDTTAINSAIAAMTNYSTLYFPAGSYLVTPGSITNFASLNHITVMGDGRSSQLTSTATGSPSNFLVFGSTCDHVTVRDLSIVGAATVRGSGIGIRMYASYSLISNVYIYGTSDFAMLISNDASSTTTNVIVTGCLSDHSLGDGFHFGAISDATISNCQAYYTGDDGLGIGDDGAVGRPATRIEVVNFQSMQAGNKAGGGTHGAGIRIFDGAVDVHITGGAIYQSCEAGLAIGRFSSTTAYNTRIVVNGLKVYQCLQQAGMYANMSFQWVNSLSVKDCWSEAPVSQGCYAFLDCNNVTVTGNTAKDAVVRAFLTDDSTTTNVAATWSNWTFIGNACLGTPSNESYYFVPATGKTITNLLITGNTETGQSSANYISTNRLAGTCKINNNTSLGGKTITNGGSGVAPTTTNNN